MMSLTLVGINHQSGPVEIRERLAARGAAAVREALAVAGWREVVVISTCNRFEIYAAGVPKDAKPVEALVGFLNEYAGGPVSEHLYFKQDSGAVAHLLEVAAGLDSLVLGETEILGQVKEAYEDARDAGTTAKRTNVLFQRALFVGKSVRSLTAISMGQVSMASVAVELAKRIFGDLGDSEVLLLGAGEMAEKTARHLISAKVSRLHIANRTWEHGRDLADRLRADPVRWDAFSNLLGRVDVVIASTGSPMPVVTYDLVTEALKRRDGRSLFLIDIAMPRDVDQRVDSLDGVYAYRMEDLSAIVYENVTRRSGEFRMAREIVSRESERFCQWLDSLGSGREISLRHSQLRPLGRLAPIRISS